MGVDPEPEGGRLFFQSPTFEYAPRAQRPLNSEMIHEPPRATPVHASCDVLVVGGGPAGTTAAIAAARGGAAVILLERYNHLGGLSTGGLVIWIDRMTDWTGRAVIRGLGEELMTRLPPAAIVGPRPEEWGSRAESSAAYWAQRLSAHHGIVTNAPTIDPEALKALSMQLAIDAGVDIMFHGWGVQPVTEGATVIGCIFESKEGRRAIKARVTIDATGDGDLFAAAGEAYSTDADKRDIHAAMNVSWLAGGIDMKAFLAFQSGEPQRFAEFMQRGRERIGPFAKPNVGWRDDICVFMGPRLAGYSAVRIDDLTDVEIKSRQLMLQHLDFYRAEAPGFANAFLMLSSPQLGVRHGRRVAGVTAMVKAHWDGRIHADEIGVSPSLAPKIRNVSVPFGAIVPRTIDGLLAPGRHLACDTSNHSFMREIPQCWLTGHAAGVAAALAVSRGVAVRHVPIAELQNTLREQGAYLSTDNSGAAEKPANQQAAPVDQ